MKFPLVYIEWCDAIDGGSSWQSVNYTKHWAENEDWIIKQVGWILKETKKYILICAKYNPQEGEDGMVSYPTKIPKTWIIKRKKIKL